MEEKPAGRRPTQDCAGRFPCHGLEPRGSCKPYAAGANELTGRRQQLEEHVTGKERLFESYGFAAIFMDCPIKGKSNWKPFALAVLFQLLLPARPGVGDEPFQVGH